MTDRRDLGRSRAVRDATRFLCSAALRSALGGLSAVALPATLAPQVLGRSLLCGAVRLGLDDVSHRGPSRYVATESPTRSAVAASKRGASQMRRDDCGAVRYDDQTSVRQLDSGDHGKVLASSCRSGNVPLSWGVGGRARRPSRVHLDRSRSRGRQDVPLAARSTSANVDGAKLRHEGDVGDGDGGFGLAAAFEAAGSCQWADRQAAA